MRAAGCRRTSATRSTRRASPRALRSRRSGVTADQRVRACAWSAQRSSHASPPLAAGRDRGADGHQPALRGCDHQRGKGAVPHRARRCAGLPGSSTTARRGVGCATGAARRGGRSGDFNLPDNCTGEQVDTTHGKPTATACACGAATAWRKCCDMGICVQVRKKRRFDDWAAVLDFMEDARVDMQIDTCTRWERL